MRIKHRADHPYLSQGNTQTATEGLPRLFARMISSTGRNGGGKMVICVDMKMPVLNEEEETQGVADMHMLALRNEAEILDTHMKAITADPTAILDGVISDGIKKAAQKAAEAAKKAREALVNHYKKATQAAPKEKIEVIIPDKYLEAMSKLNTTTSEVLVTVVEILKKLVPETATPPSNDTTPPLEPTEGAPMYYVVQKTL